VTFGEVIANKTYFGIIENRDSQEVMKIV